MRNLIFVVLLMMFTSVYFISCDNDSDSEQDDGVRTFLIFRPDSERSGVDGVDVTDLEDSTGANIFGRLSEVTDNSGWATYRLESSNAEEDLTDCGGAYKVSYLEKVADNRFVGAGICLDSNNPNVKADGRIENLRNLVDRSTDEINALVDQNTDDSAILTQIGIDGAICDRYATSVLGSLTPPIDSEMGELYLFMGTLEEGSAVLTCHPNSDLVNRDIYMLVDDFGREFAKQAIDEINGMTDQSLIDSGVWAAYRFPKLGEPNTLSDPPKLSYFKRSNNGKYFVGSGIYLDRNNPNAMGDGRLEQVRDRVSQATALLLGNEGSDLEAVFDSSSFGDLAVDSMDMQAYIFVWENR